MKKYFLLAAMVVMSVADIGAQTTNDLNGDGTLSVNEFRQDLNEDQFAGCPSSRSALEGSGNRGRGATVSGDGQSGRRGQR